MFKFYSYIQLLDKQEKIVCWLAEFIYVSINAHFFFLKKNMVLFLLPARYSDKEVLACFTAQIWFFKCPVLVHKSSHALFFIHYKGMCNIHASFLSLNYCHTSSKCLFKKKFTCIKMVWSVKGTNAKQKY